LRFQKFRHSQIEKSAVLKYLTTLPSSVFELFIEKSRAAVGRMFGVSAYGILVVRESELPNLKLYPGSPFNVFVSDPSTWKSVEDYTRSSKYPILHVTTADEAGTTQLGDLGRFQIKDLYVRVLNFLEESGEPEMVLLPDPLHGLVNWDRESVALTERDHGATVPNEVVLKSLAYRLDPLCSLPQVGTRGGDVNAQVIQVLRDGVTAVRAQRAKFLSPVEGPPGSLPIETVIWSAGVGSHLPDSISHDGTAPKGFLRVLRGLLRQRDYIGFPNVPADDFKEMFGSVEARAAISMRKLELELSAAALGVFASGHFAPVIRLRPAVNLVRGQMKQIVACAAANGPRRVSKLSKLVRALGAKLAEEIGTDCMRMIEAAGEGIKLVSNAPLEYLPIDGLPLQLRRTVSRLPNTPGALFLNNLTGAPNIYLSPSELKSVLIVRSFDDGDPIKYSLSMGSDIIMDSATHTLDLRMVDVRSTEEFVAALNSYTGKILVFDGHGTHDNQDKIGYLKIGKDFVTPFELMGRIRKMPPIVILSACSTSSRLVRWDDRRGVPNTWSYVSSCNYHTHFGARRRDIHEPPFSQIG